MTRASVVEIEGKLAPTVGRILHHVRLVSTPKSRGPWRYYSYSVMYFMWHSVQTL